MSDPAQTFEVGDVVYTLDDQYTRDWFHNWPGIVRSHMRGGRDLLVEFMGFDKVEKRQVVLPVGAVQHLQNAEIGARVNRIVRQLRVPVEGPAGRPVLRKPEPKIARDLPDDEDDDFLH